MQFADSRLYEAYSLQALERRLPSTCFESYLLEPFEISDDAGGFLIRWGDVAEIRFDSEPGAGWRWVRKPPAPAEAIACERQAEVFQHRCCRARGSAWQCGSSPLGHSLHMRGEWSGKIDPGGGVEPARARTSLPTTTSSSVKRLAPSDSRRITPGSRLTEKSAKLLRLKDRELAAEFPGSDKWIWPGPNGTSSLRQWNACHLGIRHSRSRALNLSHRLSERRTPRRSRSFGVKSNSRG